MILSGIVRELQNYLTSAPNYLVISLQLTSAIVKRSFDIIYLSERSYKGVKDTYNNPFNNPKAISLSKLKVSYSYL
nr:MAG TPA: hypothetical protein [Caudoviricetes sp.]